MVYKHEYKPPPLPEEYFTDREQMPDTDSENGSED
jgi:hypothetical protein